ncbi:MAG: hypothetical protein GAK38_03071 [Xylophilus sp.]|nr:MAG: hypothetical protein GAK38_03071 [Xylophilus sp.]
MLEYGIPDLYSFGTQNAYALRQLAHGLKLAIERYEPRLSDLAVEVVATPRQAETASVRIDARVRIGTELRRVNFEMLLGLPDSLMRVD